VMNEITHFHGILPPRGEPLQGGLDTLRYSTSGAARPLQGAARPAADRRGPPPAPTDPGGLILSALRPLQDQLDCSLARGDRQEALRLAYDALSRIADALAAYRGDTIWPGQTRIHALLVELEELPLASRPDGTLAENGTAVHVSYCNWTVDRAEAAVMAHALATHLQTVWAGAWMVISP